MLKMVNFFRRGEALIVFLLAVVFSVLFTYPNIKTLDTRLIGVGGDTYQYLGFQSLAKQKILAGEYPFSYTDLWRYPAGFDFSRGYDSVLSNTYGALLSITLDNPTLAYNITILSSLVFNAICGYILLKTFTGSRRAGLIGLVGFGYSFYNLARATGHANLLLNGAFGLVGASLIKLIRERRSRHTPRNLTLLSISLTILGLSSAQYFMMGIILIGILAAYLLIIKKDVLEDLAADITALPNSKKYFKKLSLILAPIIILGLMVFSPLVKAVLEGGFVWSTHGDYSPNLIDFALPNPFLEVSFSSLSPISWEDRNVEHVVYLGVVEWALLAFSLIWIVSKRKLKKYTVELLLLVTFLIFSLGIKNPDTQLALPYSILDNIYPFAAVSESGRFIVLANGLGLMIIAKFLVKSGLIKKFAFFFILVLMVLERISWNGYPSIETIGGDQYFEVVQELPGEAVLDIPIFDSRHNIGAELYQKSIISGYIHWLGDTLETRSFINYNDELTRFECSDDLSQSSALNKLSVPLNLSEDSQKNSQMLERLKSNNVKTIVVHRNYQLEWENCANVLAQVSTLFTPTIMVDDTHGEFKFEIAKWAGKQRQVARLYIPQDGYLIIDAVHFSPSSDITSFGVKIGENVVDLNSWNLSMDESGNSIWTSPVDKSPIFLYAGSLIEFSSTNLQEVGFMSVNYQFDPTREETAPLVENGLEKVFESENEDVYVIK